MRGPLLFHRALLQALRVQDLPRFFWQHRGMFAPDQFLTSFHRATLGQLFSYRRKFFFGYLKILLLKPCKGMFRLFFYFVEDVSKKTKNNTAEQIRKK